LKPFFIGLIGDAGINNKHDVAITARGRREHWLTCRLDKSRLAPQAITIVCDIALPSGDNVRASMFSLISSSDQCRGTTRNPHRQSTGVSSFSHWNFIAMMLIYPALCLFRKASSTVVIFTVGI